MPDRRAPFDATVVVGFKAGGIGPFTPFTTVPGRLVANNYIVYSDIVFRNVTHYITIPILPIVAGGLTMQVGQAFTIDWQNAPRFIVSTFPGLEWCGMFIHNCFTRGGTPYMRVGVCIDPPAP